MKSQNLDTPQTVRRNLLLRNWESQNLSFLISSQSLNPSFLILGVFCQTKVLDRILNFAEAEGRNIFPKINKKDLSSRRICLPGQPLDWSWPSGQPLDRSGFGSFVKFGTFRVPRLLLYDHWILHHLIRISISFHFCTITINFCIMYDIQKQMCLNRCLLWVKLNLNPRCNAQIKLRWAPCSSIE